MAGQWRKALALLALVALLSGLVASSARAALGEEPRPGETITQYLTTEILPVVFPGAERVGAVEGTPPAAPVYRDAEIAGYIFSTWDVTQSKGFSNRPIVLLVGLDLKGRILGVRLVHHSEPIAILGLKDDALHAFTQNYPGHDIATGVDIVSELSSSVLGAGSFSQRSVPGAEAAAKVDAVSRATTSSVLMSDAIVRGARVVARSRGILPASGAGALRVDVDRFSANDWPSLAGMGAIARLRLTYGEVRAKFAESSEGRVMIGDPSAAPDDVLIDLFVALATPAGIGINLLGETWYNQYTAGRSIDDQMILVATSGVYRILDGDWEHAAALSSIELTQGANTIHIAGKQIRGLPFLHAKNAPELSERALIFFRGNRELDPTQPWQLNLLVHGKAGERTVFARFALGYQLPEPYLVRVAEPASPAAPGDDGLGWRAIWRAHLLKMAILMLGLATLTLIFVFEDRLSRYRRLHRVVRIAFLSWTLVWLVWYAGAQLTILNLLTYLHTLVSDFRWGYVLADPLILLLSGFTAIGLVLWGRAPFCGWLCPFGALQELANTIARSLRVPQLELPVALSDRLTQLKYVLCLGLVAASFLSWDVAMTGTEVEPFKTAIILRFMTAWPMVAYALLLIAAGVFVERFYCRFVCPLGGGLALLGRAHVLKPLKRRPECGARCHICESVCPVGAIKRSGRIDYNECFYCLDCQVTHYDQQICPPLVWRRKAAESGAVGGTPR